MHTWNAERHNTGYMGSPDVGTSANELAEAMPPQMAAIEEAIRSSAPRMTPALLGQHIYGQPGDSGEPLVAAGVECFGGGTRRVATQPKRITLCSSLDHPDHSSLHTADELPAEPGLHHPRAR